MHCQFFDAKEELCCVQWALASLIQNGIYVILKEYIVLFACFPIYSLKSWMIKSATKNKSFKNLICKKNSQVIWQFYFLRWVLLLYLRFEGMCIHWYIHVMICVYVYKNDLLRGVIWNLENLVPRTRSSIFPLQ